MFIIAYQHPGTQVPKWYLAKVREGESTPAQEAKGIYTLWFFLRSKNDSKKFIQSDCRYWPEFREFDEDQSIFGQVVQVGPGKFKQTLERKDCHPYQHEIHLPTIGIVGPFDFVTIDGQPYRVPPAVWDILEEKAEQFKVSVDDLRKKVPLHLSTVRFKDHPTDYSAPYYDWYPVT
jgi:hypothetical protein